ncbi:ATP-binding protein [Kocuria sabuli]|uniref:ATP-binding protein n=1 Tax=Kocuria sabuli TaxID=3071448 RepID=UPI0034D55327
MTTTTGLPVILTGQALQSLRESGYSLPAALGEVIDNSIEANANTIRIRLEEGTNARGKKHVHRIAFSDDGGGMEADVLQHYPQIGHSSRYMRTDTIGKFGVGAKLAALNYGTRLDVWSRTKAEQPWLHVYFDLNEALETEKDGGEIRIAEPDVTDIPEGLEGLLPADGGTLVVWSNVDRLEHGMRAENFNTLRVEVEKELSRIFRVFINDGINIEVNGKSLLPHDPLMLMSDTWAEKVLTEYYTTGDGKNKPWKPERLDFAAKTILQEELKVGGHTAMLTVTLYPASVIRKRGLGDDKLATAVRVPENLGAISFMRHDREISYTNVPRIFSRAVQDPDRFIGIEVSFSPELDEYFGVRNVKRGAEPHDELRSQIRNKLGGALETAHKLIQEYWGDVQRKTKEHDGEHIPLMNAVAEANRTMPKARAESNLQAEQVYDDLATDVLGARASAEERHTYIESRKDLPFVIESVDFPGKLFIDIQHVEGSVVIRINTRHPFYREVWEPLKAISESEIGLPHSKESIDTARRTIEAMSLMLIAYGKAESMHENPERQYGELRDHWGMFLSTMMGKVKDVL